MVITGFISVVMLKFYNRRAKDGKMIINDPNPRFSDTHLTTDN